jgi:2-polyprenyl-3-methyl-5-hydroxy-6-metoxy-1,4-benzoquinol methylase
MKQQDIYKQLDIFSQQADPWRKEKTAAYQKKSYKHLLSLITRVPHRSILEIGCAQGDFTRELVRISSQVTAIDVSASAIATAQKQITGVAFQTVSLEDFTADSTFDVIVCAEVLYYILNRKKALQKLHELGTYVVTSNFLVCFPMISIKSLQYEWVLRRFPLIHRIIEYDIRLGLLDIKSLRKLQ